MTTTMETAARDIEAAATTSTIMGRPAILAEVFDVDEVAYGLWQFTDGTDRGGAIIVSNMDPDEVVTIKAFPTYGAALDEFEDTKRILTKPAVDPHKPSTFDPATYEYAGFYYQGPRHGEGVSDYEMEMRRRIAANPYSGNHKESGTCDHCGSHFFYGEVFSHANGDLIVVGHICAEEAFGHSDRRSYDRKRMQQLIAGAKKRGKVAAEARQFCDDHAGLEAALQCDHHISSDLRAKLLQYGSLSDKQVALAMKLPADVAEAAKRVEARKAAAANSQHVGTVGKREDFTVTVVAMPSWDTEYGLKYAVIMRDDDDNALVWLTGNPGDMDKGGRYTIKATVKDHGKRDDEKQTVLQRVKVLTDVTPEEDDSAAE